MTSLIPKNWSGGAASILSLRYRPRTTLAWLCHWKFRWQSSGGGSRDLASVLPMPIVPNFSLPRRKGQVSDAGATKDMKAMDSGPAKVAGKVSLHYSGFCKIFFINIFIIIFKAT